MEGLGRHDDTARLAFPPPVFNDASRGLACRALGSGLYEVRSSLPTKQEARLIFFHDDETLIVVGGFIKKTRTAPDKEIKNARKKQAEYKKNKGKPK